MAADTLPTPNVREPKFLAAVDDSLSAFTSAFSENTIAIGFFPYNDGAKPRFDEVIATHMAAKHPRVGGFMENLKGSTPAYSESLPIVMLHEKSTAASPPVNWMQACGAWSTGSLCSFDPGDDSAMAGIAHATGSLYAGMVEIYITDIEAFGEQLQQVHDSIQAAFQPIPAPGNLRVSGSSP